MAFKVKWLQKRIVLGSNYFLVASPIENTKYRRHKVENLTFVTKNDFFRNPMYLMVDKSVTFLVILLVC